MLRHASFAALVAVAASFGVSVHQAHAASPANHCTFTTPASFVCPHDLQATAAVQTPVRTAAVADHCILLSPASMFCPGKTDGMAMASAAPVNGRNAETVGRN